MSLAIIGDVHGKYDEYIAVAKQYEHTIQLGDMGFDYLTLQQKMKSEGLSPSDHVFFGGNHDNYDIYCACNHSLGNYGITTIGGHEVYYVRGAFSIDMKRRLAQPIKQWWDEEQMYQVEMDMCLRNYRNVKPDVMITHTAPKSIVDKISNPEALRAYGFDPLTFTTSTQEFLQELYDIHQPKLWIHGHFHTDYELVDPLYKKDGRSQTKFVGVGELVAYEIGEDHVS